jgi:poly-gamma-glutamate synthesis protein (capsule biosynthesis protein)
MGEPVGQDILIMETQEIIAGLSDGSITFSIVPFDNIIKESKVLEVSGLSVFDRDLTLEEYPFAFSVSLSGDDKAVVDEVYSMIRELSLTNRDMSKFTSIMMTGVTAMARSRSIGKGMDELGVLYPAEKIADTLRSADITHISNEIPFVEDCPGLGYPLFCSDPDYIELLRYVGTDVIELTGNHMNDYGNEWILYTIEMYEEEGWPYFGGGKNLQDCYNPAVLESNGHKFAFLGLNWFGPEYTYADEDTPGSARGPQEEYFVRFEEIIKDLKEKGYIVIFTFQYEEYADYSPLNHQVRDFRRMIEAGADIVSGSQSHYPMGVEFYNDGFINYGLGNLFFDMGFKKRLGLIQGIIANHIFYEGEHINTVLITTMLDGVWNVKMQVLLSNPEERAQILDSIFKASIR